MRISDWSSDVCSSDLQLGERGAEFGAGAQAIGDEAWNLVARPANAALGDVERKRRLPRDEAGEFGAVRPLAVAPAGLRAKAVAERVERRGLRSEEHTSELQSLMRISYAVFCLKKKRKQPR